MERTLAALERITPAEYAGVTWPRASGFRVYDLAAALIFAAERLAASTNGFLIGVNVGVVSTRPEHFILARLLCCYGARVYFICTQPVVWTDGHAMLFRSLWQSLGRYHEHLDCAPLYDVTSDNFTHGANFTIMTNLPEQGGHPLAETCDLVFANEVFSHAPSAFEHTLARLGIILRGGGTLELFGFAGDPALLDHCLRRCSDFGFSARAATRRGEGRLTLVRMSAVDPDYRRDDQPLIWKTRAEKLHQQLVEERARHWAERNRFSARINRLTTYGPLGEQPWQLGLVHTWFQGGAEAYAIDEVYPGDWMQHFEDLLASRWRPPDGFYQLPPSHWELVRTESGRVLRAGILNPIGVQTVLFPRPGANVGFRSLWRWRRQGAQTVWFHEADGWKQFDLPGYLVARASRLIARRLLPLLKRYVEVEPAKMDDCVLGLGKRIFKRSQPALVFYPHSGEASQAAWNEWLASEKRRVRIGGPADEPLKIVHYIGGLHPGGAERQLCNLAIGQHNAGIDVRVLTTGPKEHDDLQYSGLLSAGDVPICQACRHVVDPAVVGAVPWQLLRSVPHEIQDGVVNLVYELLAHPPDILHGWLDQPNVIAGIAGLLAGVPHIVLSTRNSNPTNFPRFCEHFFQTWYQFVTRSKRVHLIANSHSGAASYAEWIGLPVERFHVVFNGVCFDHFPEPSAERRRQARKLFGLVDQDRVVCGAFRLAAEKQPELFLEVVRRVRERVPRLRVLLAGDGDLEKRVQEVIREAGMESYLQLLGRRADVGSVFLASDATLLTSTLEGCPNVVLESQYLGVPVVATNGGGTGDAILHGITGFLTGVSDAAGLADSLTRILLDESLQQRLSAAGPSFVQRRFALEQMVDQTMAVYGRMGIPVKQVGQTDTEKPGLSSRVA
jgi:glycosyltransferase involved in cell wall biosynthesis